MRISKNILLKEIPFEARDCHALELYLSEMATKGWMLDEIWIFNIFKFKRCEPKNLRFTVDIPRLSDTCPDTSLQNYELLFNEYIEICESSGWKHIVEDSEYQIFFTEDTNTVDIQTDDSLKLDSLLKINSGYLLEDLLWKLNAKKSLKEGNIVKYPGLSSFKIKLLIQKYNSVAIIILLVGIFILQNENQIIYLILAFSIGFIILTIMLLVNIIKNHS